MHAIAESHGAFLSLIERLPRSDRVGSKDFIGMGSLGGDAVDLRLVRHRRKPFLLHLFNPNPESPSGSRPRPPPPSGHSRGPDSARPCWLRISGLRPRCARTPWSRRRASRLPSVSRFPAHSLSWPGLGLVERVHDLSQRSQRPVRLPSIFWYTARVSPLIGSLKSGSSTGSFLSLALRASSRSITSTALFLYCLIFDSTEFRVRRRASQISPATIRPTASNEASRASSIWFCRPSCAAACWGSGTATPGTGLGFAVGAGATSAFFEGARSPERSWQPGFHAGQQIGHSLGNSPDLARGKNSCLIRVSRVLFRSPAWSLRYEPGETATWWSSMATSVITDRSGSSFRPFSFACLPHSSPTVRHIPWPSRFPAS